jgi:pyruvate-formate lyase
MTMTLQELKDLWASTELTEYCEDIETALNYYDGDDDVDSFIDWYTEMYIDTAGIVYYSTAMEFLTKHDTSLKDSLEKAEEYGYTPSQLNSELLASLLLQDTLSN